MESSRPHRPETPETIGPFRIVRILGEGGKGVVYLGERAAQFSQQVAIKMLHPSLFPKTAEPSLEREGQLLSTLDHPGIVRMLDVEESAGSTCIVMEFVDGVPLDEYCDMNRLSLRRRVEILIDVLEAVEYAHRHLIVHADLKPANILVNAEGHPRLLDFGVAIWLSGAAAGEPVTDQYTALFASPEQRTGDRLTVTSDTYSLGLIAQNILLGLRPELLHIGILSAQISRQTSSLSNRSTAKRLSAVDEPSLEEIARNRSTITSKLLSAVHGDIESILTKALQVQPSERFQSAQELCDEFRRYLLGYPIQTRPVGWLIRSQKWALRNKLAAAFSFVLVVVVVLSSTGVVLRTREASKKRQIAIERLHDLVRLTDSLAGELYDSVHGLQGSEAAQAALLTSAHLTIHKLEAEHENDNQLKLELAREYEKLARLELNVKPQTANSMSQSTEDASRELSILQSLPASDPNVQELLQKLPAQSLVQQPTPK